MNSNRRIFIALVSAGLLWGTTVPLSKLALDWLAPAWLTFVRFGIAAVLLMPAARQAPRLGNRARTLQCGATYFVPTMQRATPGILTLPSSS